MENDHTVFGMVDSGHERRRKWWMNKDGFGGKIQRMKRVFWKGNFQHVKKEKC